MPYNFIAGTSGYGGNAPAIDTTGATLLVAGCIDNGANPTLTDSRGNTWLTVGTGGAGDPPNNEQLRVYYCVNPSVGPGHTFASSLSFGNVQVAAFSGNAAAPLGASSFSRNFAAGTTTTIDPPLTPPEDGGLVVALATLGSNSGNPQVAGFTRAAFTNGLVGTNYGGYIGYLIQTTAVGVAPVLTHTVDSRPTLGVVVFRPPPPAPTLPTITTQPQPQTVTAGQTATFAVVAAGTAPFSYQWRRNGTAISGATGASYTTPATVLGDNGAAFSVVITNAAGSVASGNAALTVNAPPPAPSGSVASTSPSGQTVTITGTFSNQVTSASATLTPDSPANGATAQGPIGVTLGSGTWTVTFAAVPTGRYLGPAVTLSGPGGATVLTGSAFEILGAGGQPEAPGGGPVAPAITTQPAAQSVTAPAAATFSVVATGTAPLAYQWRRNGAAISGATQSSYTLNPTALGDSGASFSVVISNAAGSVTSVAAVLTVGAAAVAPAITTQPVAQSVTAPAGATFSVVATGTAPLAYQWRRNGVAISGATQAAYLLPSTVVGDSGTSFDVVVSNAAGSATSAAVLLAVAAPTPQPTGGTITSSRLERGNTQAHMGKPFRAFVHVEATGELLFIKAGLTTSQLGQVAFQDGRLSAGQLYAVRWKRDDTGEQGFELLRAT